MDHRSATVHAPLDPGAVRLAVSPSPLLLAAAITVVLAAVGIALRPLLPVDETRYLSVAWEMRLSGDWLVPRLNGEPYSHKGPLLFWLINAAWLATGTAEWAARLVAPLFGLACLPLVARLGRLLWPDRAGPGRLSPLVLAGFGFWSLFCTLTYFDTMVACAALLAACGVAEAATGRRRGFALLALALPIGLLAKGPVVLLHVLPLALLAPWWAAPHADGPRARPWRWYLGVALALAAGLAIAAAWALPAARAGGADYARAILVGQTAERLVESFAHAEPWWFYVPVLPVLLFPWSVWPPLWRAAWTQLRPGRALAEPGVRACLVWVGCTVAGLTLVSGKLPHYLLPALPPLALLAARLLADCRSESRRDQAIAGVILALAGIGATLLPVLSSLTTRKLPDWIDALPALGGVALAVIGVALVSRRLGPEAWAVAAALAVAGILATAHVAARPALLLAYDLRPIAERVAQLQGQGVRVHILGRSHGELTWLGRLREPLPMLDPAELRRWLPAHPGEAVVAVQRQRGESVPGEPEFDRSYRGRRRIGIWLSDAMWSASAGRPAADWGPGWAHGVHRDDPQGARR